MMACSKQYEVPSSSISNQSIQFNQLNQEEFPYADSNTLKSFSTDNAILNFTFAKKLALLELIATEKWAEHKWEACTLSATPVIIYDFNSKPKYYQYIVLDPEKKAIGSVTAYAQKKSATMIRATNTSVPTFMNTVTKNSSVKYFQDWSGTSYTAVPSKSGDAPTQITNDSGKIVNDVKEFTDQQIAEEVSLMLADVNKKNIEVLEQQKDSLKNVLSSQQLLDIEQNKTNTTVEIKEKLLKNLENKNNVSKSYWNEIEKIKDSINHVEEIDIIQKSTKGWFSSAFSWAVNIFAGVNQAAYGNNKYSTIGGKNRSQWCGPWVANCLHRAKHGWNSYQYFENAASTTGLFGFAWIIRVTSNQRPMWPNEFTWSLLSRSNIYVSPLLSFFASDAYWHIRNGGAVIRLCSSGGELHWTLCYQTREGGSRWWTTREFRQIDNGSLTGNNNNYWSEMDWWNAYLNVYWI